mmetsp:Transcript_18023/g.67999  ORF Transcript_18023/g.67999 Transcript_18023/m.67999 type:complete len:263 (-) Transcript_18023:1579-2367(-)
MAPCQSEQHSCVCWMILTQSCAEDCSTVLDDLQRLPRLAQLQAALCLSLERVRQGRVVLAKGHALDKCGFVQQALRLLRALQLKMAKGHQIQPACSHWVGVVQVLVVGLLVGLQELQCALKVSSCHAANCLQSLCVGQARVRPAQRGHLNFRALAKEPFRNGNTAQAELALGGSEHCPRHQEVAWAQGFGECFPALEQDAQRCPKVSLRHQAQRQLLPGADECRVLLAQHVHLNSSTFAEQMPCLVVATQQAFALRHHVERG